MLSPFSALVPLLALAIMVVSALPLFVVGLWFQSRWLRHLDAPLPTCALLAVAGAALVGYAVFWCYLANAALGRIATLAVWLAAAAVLLVPSERRRLRSLVSRVDVATPLLAMLITAFFYVTLYLGVLPDPLPPDWSWLRHARESGMVRAPDHWLPLQFARRLYDAAELRNSTDRPPLQAALVLVPLPVWRTVQGITENPLVVRSSYQAFAVLLQCSWIAAAYALTRMLGLAPARTALVLLALVPSYFFFVHSVFVWPKLLAGSLAVGSFCLLLCDERGSPRPSGPRAATAAALAALGFLAHSGVATALLGFGLVLLLPRFFPGWRNALIAALVAGALLAPWLAVQSWISPSGDYIAKAHLAGVEERDTRGTFEAVAAAYSTITPREFAEAKGRKARFVLGLDHEAPAVENVESAFRAIRHLQFLHVVPSLDVLNVGWLVVPLGLVLGSPASRRLYARLGRVLAIASFCIVVWVLILFPSAIIQHGAYATMILLFVALAAAVAQLPLGFGVPLLLLHVAFAPAAVLGFSPDRQYAPVTLAASAAAYLALVALLAWFARRAAKGSSTGERAA